jgi:hypothetical protein
MLIQVTDTAGTSGTSIVDSYDVADTIRDWYPDAPAEVTQAIDDLQDAITRYDSVQYDLAQYLGLAITVPEMLTVRLAESPGDYDTTHAAILDRNGDEIDSFGGPVSEEWLPAEWDAALAVAGYTRVSGWDLTEYTALVVARPSWEIVASDRHGYGHQPQRYSVPGTGTRDVAIADARDRYGKATGLDSADIDIRVL